MHKDHIDKKDKIRKIIELPEFRDHWTSIQLIDGFMGKILNHLKIETLCHIAGDWDVDLVVDSLNYMRNQCQNRTIFYKLYGEDEGKVTPSQKVVELIAFPLEHKAPFVIICPGGGYLSVCSLQEGFPIAKKLNEMGYAAFVLRYRTGNNAKVPNAIDDLAHATEFVIKNADTLNIEKENYAIIGFSAGGHLVATFGTEENGYKKYKMPKPNAVILAYPVISMGKHTHVDSRKYFLGKENVNDRHARERWSVETHVTREYPKTYIWHCVTDPLVSTDNSKIFVEELQKNDVPVEYKVFPGDAHGWGLGNRTIAEGWIEDAIRFWKGESKCD